MPDAIHTALLNALCNCLVFLEQGDDDEVDPDSAVRTMETAAAALLDLAETDRTTLVAMIHQLADQETDKGRRMFVHGVPRMVGLVDTE
ncbi:hypothetical protein [Stackebrandtia soli]|uniref:hypothetical protein n=1 Tax=Stackebrandtia soli TaxID=1892856 RepID=UPI0039E9DD6E